MAVENRPNLNTESEEDILREMIDFINKQVGVYSDSVSSFQGNKIRIERQVARINFASGTTIENGQHTVMRTSVEDPSLPDVIHHRIIKTDDFIAQNQEAGFNEQQITWAVIVFVFAFWDEDIRPRLAKAKSIKPNEITSDAFGDLRIFRKAIIHNAGILTDSDYTKLKIMNEICKPNQTLVFSHDEMHKIFVFLKNALARLLLEPYKDLPGAPDLSKIVSVAIQNIPPKK